VEEVDTSISECNLMKRMMHSEKLTFEQWREFMESELEQKKVKEWGE